MPVDIYLANRYMRAVVLSFKGRESVFRSLTSGSQEKRAELLRLSVFVRAQTQLHMKTIVWAIFASSH